jgi:hypothetical protein
MGSAQSNLDEGCDSKVVNLKRSISKKIASVGCFVVAACMRHAGRNPLTCDKSIRPEFRSENGDMQLATQEYVTSRVRNVLRSHACMHASLVIIFLL